MRSSMRRALDSSGPLVAIALAVVSQRATAADPSSRWPAQVPRWRVFHPRITVATALELPARASLTPGSAELEPRVLLGSASRFSHVPESVRALLHGWRRVGPLDSTNLEDFRESGGDFCLRAVRGGSTFDYHVVPSGVGVYHTAPGERRAAASAWLYRLPTGHTAVEVRKNAASSWGLGWREAGHRREVALTDEAYHVIVAALRELDVALMSGALDLGGEASAFERLMGAAGEQAFIETLKKQPNGAKLWP